MKEKYMEDLKEIKDIMNRASRFTALSGWSGILAGLIALGAYIYASTNIYTEPAYQSYEAVALSRETLHKLLLTASITLILALITGLYFTTREAKDHEQAIWDAQGKRLLMNLSIPFITGALLCALLLNQGFLGFMAPLSLIFYGLALVNASKYTLNEVRSLGIMELILGLLAMQFIGSGLLFWSIGFGVLHIVYGIYMQWIAKG